MGTGGVIEMLLVLLLRRASVATSASRNWDTWWTYDQGVSGPAYWGFYPNWHMCDRGRLQSPIDIDPNNLLYDPKLEQLVIDKHGSDGVLENVGQMLVFHANVSQHSQPITIRGGPLGAYQYRFHKLVFHFGDRPKQGSEHAIGGNKFIAEIQAFGYNTDLYKNYTEASRSVNGLVGMAIMVSDERNQLNAELRRLGTSFPKLIYRGSIVSIDHVSLFYLLPKTTHYVSYDGSLTSPGCEESVTWIVMNKPIYISNQDLSSLRDLQRTESKQPVPLQMVNNYRPVQPINRRLLRTNIAFRFSPNQIGTCDVSRQKIFFKVNPQYPWKQEL